MAEQKHTPGPWRKERSRVDGFDYQIIALTADGNDTRIIALIAGDDAEANADLIAAKLELLEALQRALSWLSSYPGGNAENCYNQARAAIAKATGGDHG